MKTLKILGCLLSYPSQEKIAAFPEFKEILAQEKWLPVKSLEALDRLMDWAKQQDLLDLQEEYVSLFDRTPSLCLHLFEHVHGDSRDRGQALVNLLELYKEAGLTINTKEMPDYLPMFLEYLSIIDIEEGRQNLGEIVNILGAIAARLQNRQSLYFSVFEALIEASSCKPDKNAVTKALADATGKVSTFDELDKAWEEQNAFENSLQTTGQDIGSGCPRAEEMLARMNLPITDHKDNKETRL